MRTNLRIKFRLAKELFRIVHAPIPAGRAIRGALMDDLVSPAQFRAARAMLKWSIVELAEAASVSVAAVHGVEGRYPRLGAAGNVGAIRVALETAGVHFFTMDDGQTGVRTRQR